MHRGGPVEVVDVLIAICLSKKICAIQKVPVRARDICRWITGGFGLKEDVALGAKLVRVNLWARRISRPEAPRGASAQTQKTQPPLHET